MFHFVRHLHASINAVRGVLKMNKAVADKKSDINFYKNKGLLQAFQRTAAASVGQSIQIAYEFNPLFN
jgi:hypothetical protein